MKLLSTTALTLALTLGAVAVTGVTPAEAKKKDDTAQAAGQKFSDAFRQAAQPLQTAVTNKDWAAAKAALPAAQAAASTPDDKYQVAVMALITAQSTNDTAGASAAADQVIQSGKAPPAQLAQVLDMKGRIAYNAGDLAGSDAAFTQLVQLQPQNGDALILLAQIKIRERKTAEALPLVDQAIEARKAANQPVDEDWYRRALSIAFDAKMAPGVIKYGQQLVDAYPRADIWRVVLETFRETTPLDAQANLDTMRLMRLTNGLAGEKDYYELANAALNRGFPGEAQAVITQGTTSNMIDNKALATSKALAEIKQIAGSKIAADKATLPAADKKARAAADGKQALITGDAYMGYGQFTQALDLYKVAQQKGGVDAGLLNLHMGEALVQSGQKPAAAQAFSSVTGPLQPVAQYWAIYANKGSQPAAPAQAAAPQQQQQ